MVVAVMGQEVVIRILNQVDKSQYRGSYQYQKSIAFLPINFDEDNHFRLDDDSDDDDGEADSKGSDDLSSYDLDLNLMQKDVNR